MSKYSNQKHSGYASKREAQVGADLHALANAGKISGLREQVPYRLIPAQTGKIRNERAVVYVADFVYSDQLGLHVCDVKGFRTPAYLLKRKLMKHILDIEIEEL